MRALLRNMQTFYYALYDRKTEVIKDGLRTGQYTVTYSAPVSMSANISASKGSADLSPFGIDTQYTKTIVTTDMSCPIDENTILWIGKTPAEDGSVPHNYVVVRVARSLNSITYAIREVKVSG